MTHRCGKITHSGKPCKIRVSEQGSTCHIHTHGTEECPICHEDITTFCKTLPCGHEFHRKCISNWKDRGHHTCPMCRQPFCEPPKKYRITISVQNLQSNIAQTFDISQIPRLMSDMNIIDEDAYITEAFIDVTTEEALRSVLRDLDLEDITDIF